MNIIDTRMFIKNIAIQIQDNKAEDINSFAQKSIIQKWNELPDFRQEEKIKETNDILNYSSFWEVLDASIDILNSLPCENVITKGCGGCLDYDICQISKIARKLRELNYVLEKIKEK
jgi:hypothetical protein